MDAVAHVTQPEGRFFQQAGLLGRVFVVLVLQLPASIATAGDIFESPSPADVPELVRSLADPNVRLGASKALVAIGKPSVPQLVKSLSGNEVDVRIWSAYTLGKIGQDAMAAAPALTDALIAPERDLRSAAARSLGLVGAKDAAAIRALAKATTDVDIRVRTRSIDALGRIGPAAEAALPQLIKALDDQPVRSAAIHSIVRIGAAAVPLLSEALANDRVRLEAAEALCQLDPSTARELKLNAPTADDFAALRISLENDDKDAAARIKAARWLGQLGVDAAPVLITTFAEEQEDVVDACVNAFGDIGAPSVPLLRKAFNDKSARIRRAAIAALAAVGRDAKAAVPDLMTALTDDDRTVRHQAVQTLDVFGSDAESAVPALISVMQNGRDLEATRQLAIKVLARMASPDDEDIISALRESTEDSNFGVSNLAKQMLKTIDTRDR